MMAGVLWAALALAAIVPSVLAANAPPSPTLVNQAAAWAMWGLVAVYALRQAMVRLVDCARLAASLALALMLVAWAALASSLFGSLPVGLAVSGFATVLAAASLVLLGVSFAPGRPALTAWFMSWLAAAAISALIGCVQVFAPDWIDGEWIARSSSGGRAVGNLRQPNHLASLLLWGAIAVVPLVECGVLAGAAARRALAVALFVLIVAAVMLTGSRTGGVGVLLLLVWGLVDRRLGRFSRGLLCAAPLLYALAWWLTGLWSAAHAGPVIGAAQRIGQADPTSGRLSIWGNALALIAREPLTGVGFGEFNLAWTLTPFTPRWPEFFDHTHNLPLQILVELGLPLGGLVLALLAWALWQGWQRTRAVSDAGGALYRAAWVMVLTMGLHSLLEYPLWYAHFLFPTALAWGLCLGAGADADTQPVRWTQALGVALVLGAATMLWDYRRVTEVFTSADDATPLERRIAIGQRSWFFAHHADYARLTALEDVAPPALPEFDRATHFLLDTRLLTAWSRAYARAGDVERARWIADRLRELRQAAAQPFFAPCQDAAVVDKPFQCTPATRTFSWHDFVVR